MATGWLACDAELVATSVSASSLKEETGETWSSMRVRLQGAAPLGGNFEDDMDSERLRIIFHPAMNSNPSMARLPRPNLRTENMKLSLCSVP